MVELLEQVRRIRVSNFNDCVVIEALAGAGKTFKLSLRYLELIQMGEDPKTILATTFSRKAAGEIRDKIIQQVAEAVLEKEDGDLGKLCGGIPKLSILKEEEQRKACSQLLRDVISNLHNLQISTIDSFFVRTAKAFGDEIGFPPEWSILDKIQEYRLLQEAISNMFATMDSKEMAEAIRLAEDSSVVPLLETIDTIRKFAYNLIRQTGRDAWVWGEPLPTLSYQELHSAIDNFESQTATIKGQLNSIPKDANRARTGDWKKFFNTGLPVGMLNETYLYSKKPIEQNVVDALQPIVDHACAIIANRVFAKNEGIYDLMELFHKSWAEIKHKKGLYLFDDITHYLKSIFNIDNLKELSFRLDNQIDHLLIDEFQDTSIPQWEIMKQIVDEIQYNPQRSLFFVGDPKQSLYGFRGGEPQLLRELPKLLGLDGVDRLPTSYRCSPPVVDLVNKVFESAEQSEILSSYSAVGVKEWKRSFVEHVSANPTKKGFAAIHTTDVDEDRKPKLCFTVDKVAEIVRGIYGKNKELTIGILVRKNTGQQIQRIVHALRSHPTEPVPASEHGGNPLTDSPLVTVILSALLIADHPGDTASLFHVSTSPMAKSLGLGVTWKREDAFDLSKSLRQRIMNHGYGNVVCELAEPLFAGASKRDKMRLWQLIELAETYSSSSSLRSSDFVEFVKKTQVPDPATSNVQVMTVHASKGLGFDAVVVCDLNESLWRNPKLLTLSENQCEPPVRVSVYENESYNNCIPKQDEMWEQCKSVQVQEALSLLYVATTRAKHAVHLVIPPRPKNENAKKYSPPTSKVVDRFLRQVLDIDEHLAPNEVVWKSDVNDEDWWKKVCADSEEGDSTPQINLQWANSKNNHRAIASASPSSLEGGGKTKVIERFAGGTNTAFDRGTIIHKWFEDIEWFDKVPSIEDLVASAPSEEAGRLGKEHLEDAAAKCIQALQLKEVQELLTKPDENVSVYREQEFVVRVEKGTTFAEVVMKEPTDIRGSIDRLVVYKDEQGSPERVEVIDWKSDTFDKSDLKSKIENYAPQLATYRLAAAKLLDIGVDQVSACLAFTMAGHIEDVTKKATINDS